MTKCKDLKRDQMVLTMKKKKRSHLNQRSLWSDTVAAQGRNIRSQHAKTGRGLPG